MSAADVTPLRPNGHDGAFYDAESEMASLGIILKDVDQYRLFSNMGVAPETFDNRLHGRIYAMLQTFATSKSISLDDIAQALDKDAVLAELGGRNYLMRLVGASAYQRPAKCARTIIDLAQRRKIRDDSWEDDDGPITPRGWLLGSTFCRQFLSVLVADGGTGKTALRIAQYLACATGRNLTNEHVFTRCRVLIICLEDSKDELRRRLRAVRLHYNVTADEIKGWLRLWTPKGIRLMEPDNTGKLVAGELQRQLRDQIERGPIDLVGIDPFVKSHGGAENDNQVVDMIAGVLTSTAQEFNCAADTVHHTRKGSGDPGNADIGRGASALKDAARIVDTLTPMTAEEANLFGVDKDERRCLIRLDNAKVNLAPRAADARWFKLIGVHLLNGNETYPHGDTIQTVEPWSPPDNFADVSDATWNAIIDEIDADLPNGRRYTSANSATDRAAWKVVIKHLDRTEQQARGIIRTWVLSGALLLEDYHDPVQRSTLKGLRANPAKRPGNEVRY